eukprot:CAMPEP_0117531952 /NCGR_PEP_ID=MMETSP0784-20121206/39120_1 /TAXON_ID=39447 /ORGANISM="" /LENGTH=384 /DNA_ID=CAMNT_0005328335 /DNA_START=85 /DNA_END=1239 /DNA_ORIENTATION=+
MVAANGQVVSSYAGQPDWFAQPPSVNAWNGVHDGQVLSERASPQLIHLEKPVCPKGDAMAPEIEDNCSTESTGSTTYPCLGTPQSCAKDGECGLRAEAPFQGGACVSEPESETETDENSPPPGAIVQATPPAPLMSEPSPPVPVPPQDVAANDGNTMPGEQNGTPHTRQGFTAEETILIFDWDDTVLPSTWVHSQGLRLDEESQPNLWQREQLDGVARAATETLTVAMQLGTVVLVTNAERGWIELSCRKFMPSLCPVIESLKLLSARSTYESPELQSPLDWKLLAFNREVREFYGHDRAEEARVRKNVVSLGDSVHEREALLQVTAALPNCRSKSLKFVERPDISEICKQHALVTSCFEQIVHCDGNLDLCMRCDSPAAHSCP